MCIYTAAILLQKEEAKRIQHLGRNVARVARKSLVKNSLAPAIE